MFRTTQQLTVALFHSRNPSRDSPFLDETIKMVKGDDLLSRSVHLICTDDPYCKSLMRHNQSGLTVPDFPVFLTRIENGETKIRPLLERDELFESIRSQSAPTQPIISEDPVQPLSQPSQTAREIPWSLQFFSKRKDVCLKVHDGETLQFNSPEDQLHDVTEATSRWESIRRLIPRQYGLNESLTVTPDWKKNTYLICTVGENNKVMRLKLIRHDEYRQTKGVEEPKIKFGKVTITSKPQIVTMEDGTRVKIVAKPKVIMSDSS